VRPEDIHNYLEAGISSVIAKPVHKEQLLQAVAGVNTAAQPNFPTASDDSQIPLLDQAIIRVHQQMLGSVKLATLMQGFCKVHNELWPALQQSIQATDDYEISQQAHKLAGACDTIGFTLASHLLRQLEQQADNGDTAQHHFLNQLHQVMVETVELAINWKT